jgi:hypothetical protein
MTTTTKRKYRSVPAKLSRFSWRYRGNVGFFEPNGAVGSHGPDLHPNKRDWQTDAPLYAARIFVGFNVGDEPRWTMDDLVPIVKRVRTEQVGSPDSSFLYQRGVYAHQRAGDTTVADEQGAQIIILNVPDFETEPDEFESQIVQLAEIIAEQLLQETVIVEIQRAGQTLRTISVVPG